MYTSYTVVHWLFFFYFYCFFGWCFESAYVSLKCKRWVNRGFMRGPFLPLYGSGGIMMLLVSMPYQDNTFMVYVSGCIGATLLEYVTGVVMEAIFKIRYWDYSSKRFNFKGYICLESSLAWGFLTILMTEWMHKPVEWLVMRIPLQILTGIVIVLTVVIGADFSISFKAALDLRDALFMMEKARKELMRIQKRMDVIIALTSEELAARKETLTEDLTQRREELSDSLEVHMENIENRVENIREEIVELRLKYNRLLEDRERLKRLKGFSQRNMLRAHPSMSSARFREALEELKEQAAKRLDKRQDPGEDTNK